MKEILIPCAAHGTSYCKQRICRWRSPFEIGKGERTLFLRNQHSVKPDPAVSAGTGGNTDGIKFSWFKPDLVTGHSKQFQKFLRHFIVPDFKQSLDLRIPGDTQAEIASPVCAERISGKSPPVGFREFLLRFEAELQCKRLEIISETRCRIIMLFTADKSMISQFTAIQLRFQRFLVESYHIYDHLLHECTGSAAPVRNRSHAARQMKKLFFIPFLLFLFPLLFSYK